MVMDVHTLCTNDIVVFHKMLEFVLKGKLSHMEIRFYISLLDLVFMKGYSGSI